MSRSTPPPAALRKLPILATVYEAYGRVFGQLGLLLRAAVVPFALSVALVALSLGAPASSFLNGLFLILGFVPYTIFGVAWHRLTLLGAQAAAPPLVPGWARRHWRFLGYLAAVVLIGYGVAFLVLSFAYAFGPGGGEPDSVLALLVLPALVILLAYVMMRLSFVFPAVAVDESYGLRHAWAHTEGQGFRLLVTVLLAILPLVVLLWVVSTLFGVLVFTEPTLPEGQGSPPPAEQFQAFVEANWFALFVSQLIVAAINYAVMALAVSVISIAFRTCTGWVPDSGGPPAPLDADR